jgi:hypothetical protein
LNNQPRKRSNPLDENVLCHLSLDYSRFCFLLQTGSARRNSRDLAGCNSNGNFDADPVNFPFADRVPCSKRDAFYSRSAAANRRKFASCERDCSFNPDYPGARRIAPSAHGFSPEGTTPRKIPISGAKIPTAKSRTYAHTVSVRRRNLGLFTEPSFQSVNNAGRKIDEAGRERTKTEGEKRAET